MKKKVVEMYLEDLEGKGRNVLILVDEEGNEYGGDVEVHNSIEDVRYYRINK